MPLMLSKSSFLILGTLKNYNDMIQIPTKFILRQNTLSGKTKKDQNQLNQPHLLHSLFTSGAAELRQWSHLDFIY